MSHVDYWLRMWGKHEVDVYLMGFEEAWGGGRRIAETKGSCGGLQETNGTWSHVEYRAVESNLSHFRLNQ